VVVVIPFSKNVKTANFNVITGTILFDESTKIAKWNVGKLTGDNILQLSGTLFFHGPAIGDEAPAVELEWKVSKFGYPISNMLYIYRGNHYFYRFP
jgi:hypothetical protein